MRALRTIGLMLAAIAAGVAAGAAALVCDPPLLARGAGRVGSALLGRHLRVGNLSVHWASPIRLAADNLHLANAPWGSAADMLSIRRLEADVEVWPLLGGRLVLRRISVAAPDLLLETSASGEGNWSGLPWPAARRLRIPEVREAAIEGGRATFHSIATGARLDADRLQARAVAPDAASPVTLASAGRVREQPFRFEGTAGSWGLLHAGAQPYPIKLGGELAGLRVAVDGTSMEPLRTSGTRLHFAVDGGDLRGASRLTRLPLPEASAFSAGGDVTRGQGEWSLDHLEGRVGTSAFTGEATFDPYRPTPVLRMSLLSARANLGDFASILDSGLLRPPGHERGPRGPGWMNSDARVPVEALSMLDADISLAVGRVDGAAGLPLKQATVKVVLGGGTLRVDALDIAVANGRVAAHAEYAPGPDAPSLRLQSELRQIDVHRLLADVPGPQMIKQTSGTLEGFVRLQAKGASPRALSRSLGGDLGVSLQGGTISELAAASLQSDIPRMIGLGGGGDGTVRLNCLISHFTVRGGTAVASPFVIDTRDMTARVTGGVNLGDETLLLDLVPHLKRYHPLKLGTSFKLRGSFDRPQLQQGPDAPVAGVRSAIASLIPPELDGSRSASGQGDGNVCSRARAEARRP